MRNWYRFQAQADPAVVDVHVFGPIGPSIWDDGAVTAATFVAALEQLAAGVTTIRVHVNSPGGDVFEATTIANALRAQRTEHGRTVDVAIEGLAASAASIITMAGAPIRIADNALVMIHDPMALTFGNAGEHRAMSDALDKIRDSIVATYRWTSPRSEDELRAMMAAETWMDADEAIANGFATEKISGTSSATEDDVAAAARFQPEILARLRAPERFAAQLKAFARRPPAPTPAPIAAAAADVMRLCREARCSFLAEQLVAAAAPLPAVHSRIDHAREVLALCQVSRLNDLAAGYISANVPLEVVRAHVTNITARIDGAIDIDGGLLPDDGRPRHHRAQLAPREIYAERNRRPEAR
jgi:ATP-dependent protease ClpP protease subunit